MHKKKKNKLALKMPANIEYIMIFMIAICQISLIGLSTTSMSEVSDISQYGFMSSQTDEDVLKALQDWNLDFRPNACKLISIYDEDLTLKIRFCFMKTPDRDLVNVNLQFRNYVLDHDQGYLDVEVESGTEHVFFRWIADPHESASGRKALVVVRVNQPTYFYVWVYPIISVMNIILIFMLLLTIMMKRRQDGISNYMAISNDRRYM